MDEGWLIANRGVGNGVIDTARERSYPSRPARTLVAASTLGSAELALRPALHRLGEARQ
jgi:hypothetical protein